jgi:hypothetical protein
MYPCGRGRARRTAVKYGTINRKKPALAEVANAADGYVFLKIERYRAGDRIHSPNQHTSQIWWADRVREWQGMGRDVFV